MENNEVCAWVAGKVVAVKASHRLRTKIALASPTVAVPNYYVWTSWTANRLTGIPGTIPQAAAGL